MREKRDLFCGALAGFVAGRSGKKLMVMRDDISTNHQQLACTARGKLFRLRNDPALLLESWLFRDWPCRGWRRRHRSWDWVRVDAFEHFEKIAVR